MNHVKPTSLNMLNLQNFTKKFDSNHYVNYGLSKVLGHYIYIYYYYVL